MKSWALASLAASSTCAAASSFKAQHIRRLEAFEQHLLPMPDGGWSMWMKRSEGVVRHETLLGWVFGLHARHANSWSQTSKLVCTELSLSSSGQAGFLEEEQRDAAIRIREKLLHADDSPGVRHWNNL